MYARSTLRKDESAFRVARVTGEFGAGIRVAECLTHADSEDMEDTEDTVRLRIRRHRRSRMQRGFRAGRTEWKRDLDLDRDDLQLRRARSPRLVPRCAGGGNDEWNAAPRVLLQWNRRAVLRRCRRRE